MAETLESEFISKFHSLSGITIKERCKQLRCILNETQRSLDHAGRKIDLSTLNPKTPLEEYFKIQALIYFKCANDLFNVLKTENSMHIDQVLKHPCFLKEALDSTTPEYLTTQIFPNMSYCTKQKLLNKLSSQIDDADRIDQYFKAIQESYGLHLASNLLPACSSDVVIKCIEFYKVELRANQLLIILKKWPNLTELILEKLDQQNAKLSVGEKYCKFFKYLAKTDEILFLKLYYKYYPDICLGTKETDKFIKKCKNEKTFSSIKICQLLNKKQIAKSLGNDFDEFYYRVFPKCISVLKDDLDSTLKLLGGLPSKPAKLIMFSTTFKKVYGNEIWEYSEFMIPKLIKWMSPEDREVFLQNHSRPVDIWEEVWISYHKTDKSLPLLKEKISLLSSIKGRLRYICALLKTCKFNRDSVALLDVLKYINIKHRNDNVKLLQEVLRLLSSWFDAKRFTEEQWLEINLCVQYYILNNNNCYHYCRDLQEKYICYRLTHNLPIKEDLERWLKEFPEGYNICENNPKFQRICLVQFEEFVPLENKNACVSYWYYITEFNNNNPKNKLVLDIKNETLEYLKELLVTKANNSYRAESVIRYLIVEDCIKTDEIIFKLYFSANYYNRHHFDVLNFLVKTNPIILIKYFNVIVSACNKQNGLKEFLKKFCTMYTHLNITDAISKICYDIIKEEEDSIKFRIAVTTLSILTTPEEFLSFASSYYPSEPSVNVKIKDKQILYKKQQAILNAFPNLQPLSAAFEGILQFCKGDYFKFVQRSLVLASVHTIENKLSQLFDALKKRAVSVRKHAIFLTFKVSTTRASDLLLEFAQDEKNTSIITIIFKTAFCMFLQNPNDHSWKLALQRAELVNFSSNQEAFNIVMNCQRVPPVYFERYINFAWGIAYKCTGDAETIESGKTSLLNLVTSANISGLSRELCLTIIGRNLFKCEQLTDFQTTIQSFTCKYLLYSNESQEQRLQYIFSLFKDLLGKNSSNIAIMSLKCKLVNSFVKQLCSNVMDKKCTNKDVFEQFLNIWELALQPYEACDEFIYLRLTSLYLKAVEKNLNIMQIGVSIASLCDLLYNQNCLDVHSFSDSLKEFLEHFYALEFIGNSDENQIILIESIVSNRNSYACLELVLSLMPSCSSIPPIIKHKYDNIIDVISKEPNRLLQVVFKSYLKNTIHDEI